MNGKRIFSGTPDCEIRNQHEISATDLQVDSNTILFETEKGNYRLDAPTVTTNLKDVRTFVEYFNVEKQVFEDILAGKKKIFLEIDFIDDNKRKKAELNINGRPTVIDQPIKKVGKNFISNKAAIARAKAAIDRLDAI